MVILPVEKRIDWRYPPVVLFTLVFVNILVFFLYQSGDDEKYAMAMDNYEETGYWEFERQAYADFMLADDPELSEVSLKRDIEGALLNRDFYDWLKRNASDYVPIEEYREWQDKRQEIQLQFHSLSALAYGLVPRDVSFLTLVSHQFLHGGIMHLLGNMIFLMICGFAVEAALGHFKFLLFYLIGGMFAGGFFSWLQLQNGPGFIPLIGASGAVSAVMAMYLMVFRNKRIEFFYWFFIFVGYFRAPALLILPFYVFKELYDLAVSPHSNVAFMAHVGGFFIGATLVFLARLHSKENIDEAYVEQDLQLDPYLQALDEVYRLMADCKLPQAYKKVLSMQQSFGDKPELSYSAFHLARVLEKDDEKFWQIIKPTMTSKSTQEDMLKLQRMIWDYCHPLLCKSMDDENLSQLAIRMIKFNESRVALHIVKLLEDKSCDSPMFVKAIYQLVQLLKLEKDKDHVNHYQSLYDELMARVEF